MNEYETELLSTIDHCDDDLVVQAAILELDAYYMRKIVLNA